MKTTRRNILLSALCCISTSMANAQSFGGNYTTEWQWDMNKGTNWVNLLRLEMSVPLWKGGSLEAATLHVAKTGDGIIDDWQGFSNIETDNMFAGIAVLGYMHEWKAGHLFVGVRNVNEDFFTSDVTALFTNSSCGIFPTIAASYPIANYPLSGLTVYFDVSRGGWTFRNSLYNGVGYNGWKHHDNPFIINPKRDGIFNMSQLEYSWRGALYLPELLSIPAGSSSTTKVRWRQPMRLSTRRAAPGGCMANSRCGNQTGRPSPVWLNIQKTPAARAVAIVMPNWEALIPTVSTCVASPDSMHSSVRTMNSRWN